MIYKDFQDLKLSALGFGTMRLPVLNDGSGQIDQAEVDKMIDYAMAKGVNYYDTAYPYMASMSEVSVGKALSRYPRESTPDIRTPRALPCWTPRPCLKISWKSAALILSTSI